VLWQADNAISAEAPALVATAALLAASAGFQRLVEAGPYDAPQRVVVGPWDSVADQEGRQITLEELTELGGFAQIYPGDDESHVAIEDDAAASCPVEGGTFEVLLRRPVRQGELAEGGLRDVYLWALDCISAIELDLVAMSWERGTVRVRSVRRVSGPAFEARDEVSAQGNYVEAMLLVEWGHASE
jgi:hypothetical protein